MIKKLDKKPIKIIILITLFQIICYTFTKVIQGPPTLIGGSIDNMIPFNVYFIIPYCTWYIFLFLVPYYIYKSDKDSFIKYCISIVLSIIVANIVYVVFPTTIIRPNIEGNNIIEIIARIVFWIDAPPRNCFPSIHCAFSLTFILFVMSMKKYNTKMNIFIIITSILIIMSTLFIKQHVFIDAVFGCILSLITFIISSKSKYLYKKFKNILKL